MGSAYLLVFLHVIVVFRQLDTKTKKKTSIITRNLVVKYIKKRVLGYEVFP